MKSRLRNISKIIFRIVVVLILLVLSLPKTASAFISPSSLHLIANALTGIVPFLLGGLALIVINLLVFLKKIKTKLKPFLIVSLVIIIFGGAHVFFQRYNSLKKINKFKAEEMIFREILNELGIDINAKLRPKLVDAVTKKDANFPICNISVKGINLENAIRSGQYKIFDTRTDALYFEMRAVGLDYFPIDRLFKNASNALRVKLIMDELNLSKEDKILLFCDNGCRSKAAALILACYDYDVSYSALHDLKDMTLVNSRYKKGKLKSNIFIDILNVKETIKNRDTCIFVVFEGTHESHGGLMAAEYEHYRNGDNNNDMYDFVKRIIRSLIERNQIKFVKSSPEVEVKNPLIKRRLIKNITKSDLAESKIVCFNRGHAFLTGHYLNYIDATDVEKIYVLPLNE